MVLEIYDGGLLIKDPNATAVYVADWDRVGLPAGVSLVDGGILTVRPEDASLVVGAPRLLSGNRKTQFSVSGGRKGRRYRITHRVTTDGSPAEVPERSFYLLIQEQ